jgi:hypothetical protein
MTETLNRPTRPAPRRTTEEPAARSPLAAGSAAAVWAVAAGLLCLCLPVLLVWAVEDRSGSAAVEALRTGARLWLVAHGVPLEVPGGRFALTPLGLALVPLALVCRFVTSGGRACAVPGLRAARRLALGTALPYAVLVGLVAALTSDPEVHISPVLALLYGGAVGAVGAAVGALRLDRLHRAAWHALPERARRLAVAGGAPVLLALAAGSLLVGASLVAHLGAAAELAGAGSPGVVGGLALLLACLALVPNAVVWGASWLAGPGFAVGVGTTVSPFGHELGPVPAVPLLAALPASGIPGWVGLLALLVPLVGGGLAGRIVVGRLGESPSARRTALEAALVGPVAGATLALLAWLSGGAAGGERLVEVGPAPWSVGLAFGAAVSAGAVAAALLRRRRLQG